MFVAIFFVIKFVKETKGRTLESMSEDEIEMPRGTTSSPDRPAASKAARVHHRASSISAPSTSIRFDCACATKPTMRLAGSGQGWLPK